MCHARDEDDCLRHKGVCDSRDNVDRAGHRSDNGIHLFAVILSVVETVKPEMGPSLVLLGAFVGIQVIVYVLLSANRDPSARGDAADVSVPLNPRDLVNPRHSQDWPF